MSHFLWKSLKGAEICYCSKKTRKFQKSYEFEHNIERFQQTCERNFLMSYIVFSCAQVRFLFFFSIFSVLAGLS